MLSVYLARAGLAPAPVTASRFECKYIVDPLVVSPMRQFLLSLARVDPFAVSWPDHRYPICSLYLDTDDLYFYRQYERGEKNRFKLRARTYSDAPDAPVFLETKARSNRIVTKSRAALSRDEAVQLLGGRLRSAAGPNRNRDLGSFETDRALTAARPVVRVKYWREAYVAVEPEPARVTFDTWLEYQPTFGPALSHKGGRWMGVPVGGVVVEVKFTGSLPGWIAHMVRAFGLVQQPCCKYALSIRRMLHSGAGAALSVAGVTLPPAGARVFR